ncbi:ATP-binding protein [uncultured Desulfobacter sp.]|uniref:ATP-binding protein n=1 Tax=uncultured Desulfobacter sp. TaxID=240139 RepID=UPI002AAAA2AE|nr:ATP-binding protein [uncultured Desulfobacter sp.]
MKKKIFKPEIESVIKIQNYISEKIHTEKLTDKNWFKLNLIIEEIVVNIVSYGLKDRKNGFIEVGVTSTDQGIFLEISDNGVAFNLLEKKDPDISADIKDRNPGGLGIFLIKQIAKDVQYARKDDKNIIRLLIA